MPIKIETEVRPLVWDRNTGRVVRPAGAGNQICVIVSDDEGDVPWPPVQPFRRGSTVKAEVAVAVDESPVRGRSQSTDIKSEDENESASNTLSPASRHARHAQAATIRRQGGGHHRVPSPRLNFDADPSDSSGSDGALSSSSDESGDDSSSSSDDSATAANSDLDEPSVFRPSKSPSRFAASTPPTTRSQKTARLGAGEHEQTPIPYRSATTAIRQQTSVPSPPCMSFYIPIRVADRQSGSSSRSQPTQPLFSSPADSWVHGWRPINRGKKAAQAGSSALGGQPTPSHRGRSKSRGPPALTHATSSRVPSPIAPREEPAPRHGREATAGPSSPVEAIVADQAARRASKGKSKARTDDVEVPEPEDAESPSRSEKKAKGKDKAKDKKRSKSKKKSKSNDQSSEESSHESDQSEDKVTKEKREKRERKKERKERKEKEKKEREKQEKEEEEKKKKDKKKEEDADNDHDEDRRAHHKRYGPSRRARIERTIEETPEAQLQPSAPSSSKKNTTPSSTARPESSMFLSSPIPPATPGPSCPPMSKAAKKAPERYPTPAASSPHQQSRKRTRTDYEQDVPAAGSDEAMVWQQRYAQIQERFGEEQAARERLCDQAQMQESRIRSMQDQFDDQATHLNNTLALMTNMEQTVDELKQQITLLHSNHDSMNVRLHHQEVSRQEATRPIPAAATAGPSRPHLQPYREVRPREDFDLARRNGTNPPPKATIPTTLVRPRPHGAPPNQARRENNGWKNNTFPSARSGGPGSSSGGGGSAGPIQHNQGARNQERSVRRGPDYHKLLLMLMCIY